MEWKGMPCNKEVEHKFMDASEQKKTKRKGSPEA